MMPINISAEQNVGTELPAETVNSVDTINESSDDKSEDNSTEKAPSSDDIDTKGNTPTKETILSTPIIINEIMIGSEVNSEKDIWIEFYNPGTVEIKLDGWKMKGVTKGGSWIDIVNDDSLTIKPGGYFLLSYYSNSTSSALAIKPDMQKSSLSFPSYTIEIQIKDSDENIVDIAQIEYQKNEKFEAYERNYPITDGKLSTSWSRATKQINLKTNLQNTFATPGNKNSLYIENEQSSDITDTTEATENSIDQSEEKNSGRQAE